MPSDIGFDSPDIRFAILAVDELLGLIRPMVYEDHLKKLGQQEFANRLFTQLQQVSHFLYDVDHEFGRIYPKVVDSHGFVANCCCRLVEKIGEQIHDAIVFGLEPAITLTTKEWNHLRENVYREGHLAEDVRKGRPLLQEYRLASVGEDHDISASDRAESTATPPGIPATNNKPVENGPIPPDKFHWDGKQAELPPKAWGVVNFLWGKPDHTATKDAVCVAVWGDEEKANSALPSARTEANKRFLAKEIPFNLKTTKTHVVLEGPLGA